jgi:hypothetical protein
MPLHSAEALIRQEGFVGEIRTSEPLLTWVVGQNIAPNAEVTCLSTWVLSVAERECTVPNVVGLSPALAYTRIGDAGFFTITTGIGRYVGAQSPGGNYRQRCGASVTIQLIPHIP